MRAEPPYEGGAVGQEAHEGGLRKVARVVLLDPQRVLLHGHEPDDRRTTGGFPPGIGLEGDERS